MARARDTHFKTKSLCDNTPMSDIQDSIQVTIDKATVGKKTKAKTNKKPNK